MALKLSILVRTFRTVRKAREISGTTLHSREDPTTARDKRPTSAVWGRGREAKSLTLLKGSVVLQRATPQSLLVFTTLKNGYRGLVPVSCGLEKTIFTLSLGFLVSITCFSSITQGI